MVALKTAYCPAFGHLVTLLKSGKIGEIIDVTASVTSLVGESSSKLDPEQLGGSMSENAEFVLLPVFKLLGTDYKDVTFYSKMRNGTDIYTKSIFQYQSALASTGVGLGVKSEGNLIISGTKGNAYVPAPWWKTDYFELRYENTNLNRKFFYPYEEEGLRYEIKEFISAILNSSSPYSRLSRNELIAMAQVHESFNNNSNRILL